MKGTGNCCRMDTRLSMRGRSFMSSLEAAAQMRLSQLLLAAVVAGKDSSCHQLSVGA